MSSTPLPPPRRDEDDEPTLEAPPGVIQVIPSPEETTRRIPADRMQELLAEGATDEAWDLVLDAEDPPQPEPSEIERYLRERLRDL